MVKEIENNTTDTNPNYPYSEWMLKEIKGVYAVENERENIINTKASAFITVIVAIITLYIPLIPFNGLKKFFYSTTLSQTEKNITVIFLVVLGSGFLSMLVAFFLLLKAYGIKGHNKVHVDDLLSIANTKGVEDSHKRSQIALAIMGHYHEILRGTLDRDGNIKINSASANCVSAGMVWTVIGFVVISLATIALRIIVV